MLSKNRFESLGETFDFGTAEGATHTAATSTKNKPMRILLVGGTFNNEGGRPSGYFGKLATEICLALPGAQTQTLNGGTFAALQFAVESTAGVSHLLWFADVPNELPKLLPVLKKRDPGLVLVSSKNNRKNLYEHSALFERMRRSRSELLVEFSDGPDGILTASVLVAHGEVLLSGSPHIQEVANCLVLRFRGLQELRFPLNKIPYPTLDGDSFKHRSLNRETEIPLGAHPGAFGVERKNHVHEGVDLYGQPGDAVYAMEQGVVVSLVAFTGRAAGSPWWEDTECVMVAGAHGVLNYGEIVVDSSIRCGGRVAEGQKIGELARVLLTDKGRPRTMLHLERYTEGTSTHVREWTVGAAQPSNLCDPTTLILQAAQNKGMA